MAKWTFWGIAGGAAVGAAGAVAFVLFAPVAAPVAGAALLAEMAAAGWGVGALVATAASALGVGGAAVGASFDDDKIEKKISDLEEEFGGRITFLESEIKRLGDENKSLEEQIEAFKTKEKTNFKNRIAFNEKQIISNYDNGIEMQAKIVLLFETTLKFLQKKLELINEKENNQDSDIMVVSMSSNSSLDERIIQNNNHFDDALGDEKVKTQEEIKKQQKLLEIEKKRIIYEPSRKMIFELAEEVRNNQIEANKVRDEKEKTKLISQNEKVKEAFEVLKIENNIEKPVVFVGA